ncbi:hypothetical protein A2U01_0102464, partial [Trifolium medium]|nr:hypothetical protein [Trifolium medium]
YQAATSLHLLASFFDHNIILNENPIFGSNRNADSKETTAGVGTEPECRGYRMKASKHAAKLILYDMFKLW